ncbi:MAG: hypothetical protein CMF80_04320 [Candidatus Marinimicrobia bacterium]|nr:hypothetical protein [Candidatus Neomarinimicrobiota bacterium]
MKAFFSLIFFILSCYKVPEPDWIKSTVSDNDHWYGYGVVEKKNIANLTKEARLRSIEDIASQISIDISSNFKRVIIEDNFSINEYTKNISSFRLSENIQSVEFIDSYRDKNNFYVLSRLNKNKYYETIREKRSIAVETALNYMEQADKSFGFSTFELLEKAENEIYNFIDVSIPVIYPKDGGKLQQLYPLIKYKISDYYNRINVNFNPQKIDLIYGFPNDQSIELLVFDYKSGLPIPGIPLYYLLGKDTIATSISSNIGKSIIKVPFMNDNFKQTIDVIIDHNKLFESSNYNNKVLATIPILPRSPKISVKSIEKNYSNPIITEPITQSIKLFFQKKYGAIFVQENADIHINVNASTFKLEGGKNEYGLFLAHGNLSLNILNSKKQEIFSISFNNELGRSFSNYRLAGLDAIDSLNEKMIKNLKIKLNSYFVN